MSWPNEDTHAIDTHTPPEDRDLRDPRYRVPPTQKADDPPKPPASSAPSPDPARLEPAPQPCEGCPTFCPCCWDIASRRR